MAVPEHSRRVDMARLRGALVTQGYDIVLDARILLLVRKGTESTVYQTGKVLLKTSDRGAAEAAYAELRPYLEAAWCPGSD